MRPAYLPLLALFFCSPGWPQESAILKDFDSRVSDYVKQHKKIESELPKLKPTPEPAAISEHEKELADRIRAARQNARQGDIFTPPIAAEFRRLISAAMQGPRAPRIRKSLRRAEPVRITPRVNDPYPSQVPLQSTPPTLLFNLPKLPPELDYRIVDHDLLLRDAGADLIVDFIPAAIP